MSKMKNNSDRKANRCRGAVSFFIHPSSFFILLLILCIGISTAFAQEPERIEINGSSLHAGEAFRFTVTVNSDEMLSFAEAQTQLTAVLCPVNEASGSCQTLTQSAEGTDDTTMRITFTAEALPAAGDYTLEISFVDSTGTFASQTGSYLITGVQEASGGAETPGITPTPTGTPTEMVTEIPITVKPVTLSLSVLDAEGSSLPYGATLYVNLPYTLRIKADSAMNDSVMVSAALPASLQSAPLDPQSECMQYLNAEGTALEIPGSLWTGENNATFTCEFRYNDRIWLTGEAVVFSLEAQDADESETFSMQPLKWNSYPINITQRSATHQAQISDSRGNLICSDTVHCGMFYSDEVYILTYKFPADWGAVLPSGQTFTADVTWPAEWADSMRQPQNQAAASAFGSPCEIDENGMTHFVLSETGQGRYSASCSFNPGAVTNAVQPSILIHLNDNSWAVRDLTVGLSPVIIRQTAIPTETPAPTEEVLPTETAVPTEIPTEVPTEVPTEAHTEVPTEVPTEEPIPSETAEPTEVPETLMPETPEPESPTETPLPEIEITMTVKPVTLAPSIVDESGNVLIYGSTLYVGETYYLQIHSDSAMNNSVSVDVALPASLLTAPLDPASGCLSYLNGEGTALSIPGSNWNADNGSTFRCELRFLDSVWLAANPFNFSLGPTGISADETYEMAPLSWNYYPVNIARYSATQQLQITDSKGTLICSDNVPCGMFNADDVYTITYKFPADYGAVLPSGRSFSADLRWPDNWGLSLQMANDVEIASQFGEACSVGPDGMTHFELVETAEGRYSASCTFTPGAIASPSAAAASVHLNDNSFQVTDLNILLPANIVKRQASLSPSLTVQIVEGTGEIEQIQGGTVGRLYRTTSDMPNNGDGFGSPALYTLKAQVDGVSEVRSPQWGDHVQVNWSVLDALAMTGDLPDCLVPDGNGYQLGTLSQTDSGSWYAECSFRFPLSMSTDTAGGALRMELVSGMYNTSSVVNVAAQPFTKQTLAVNLDVPETMVLNQPMEIRASLSDDSGALSDYTRAVLSHMGASLASEWEYNYATSCQGVYELSESGESSCVVEFNSPTDNDSMMHFELSSPGLSNLYDVVYRPAADLRVAKVSKVDVTVSPSLALRMTPDGGESEQIGSGQIAALYRTAGEMPNAAMSYDLPALYSLRASVSGVFGGSQPQPDDYILVNWNVLDELAVSGNLPDCLSPEQGGYRLGTLEQSGETTWSASCEFYFPQVMNTGLTGGPMSMELVSMAYQGAASAQMNGNAFRQDNLYIDVDVPGTMILREPMEIKARVSDDSGSLSDYARAVLSRTGANLYSDWAYNYVTDCQGVYDLSATGEATCGFRFDYATDADSTMHFELTSPGLAELFNVSYRPGADIPVAKVSRVDVTVSPSLALRMTPDGGESEQIGSGQIGALYRTAGDMPNAEMSYDLPALYTLRASVNDVFSGSQPQPDDYILVNWNVLDELAVTGNLPDCLSPEQGGYRLGTLEQSGETNWSASCEFYFPQVMNTGLTGGPMSMELVSMAYQGSASAQMNGNAFRQDNLYIDVDVPGTMVLNQPMEIKARVSDDTGSLSDYARAVLSRTGVSLYSDWAYNYVTECQGVYDLSATGEATCGFRFDYATDADSTMHFELNSPGLTDLFNVSYRPGADIHVAKISKVDVTVSPSLALRMTPDGGESEQIGSGWIGALYRTAGDMPNAEMSYDLPALYTLRASVSGVFSGSQPQPDDYILVNWNVLDELAVSGNLPDCLSPEQGGYRLGTLEQSGETNWSASCEFYFPQVMNTGLTGGPMSMELVSMAYQGSASAQMSGNAFHQDNLYIDVDVPGTMVLNQRMEIKARVSDDTGSLSDYARAVLSRTGVSLYSDWAYNYVTECQGVYDLSATGEATCGFRFDYATDADSTMHFELNSPGLTDLFNVSYRPGADIHVAKISKVDVTVSPSLALRMTPDGGESEQIGGGWIGTLYRTAGEMPNAAMSYDLPALYTLRATVSGVFSGSQPQPDDYIQVNWSLLDELAVSGNLPMCLTPAAEGYQLGTLEQTGETEWSASCEFYFPQSLPENLTGNMSMQMVSGAYQGAANVQMNGNAFKRENLYVDLDIPEHMLVHQMTEFRAKVSDDSGSLSDYTRAVLNAAGATLRSDWVYNYVTTCQGLYDLEMDGSTSCSALFEAPSSGDSIMHFELESPALENLFDVTYRPGTDIHIAEVSYPSAQLSVKLFHAGTEIPLPASSEEAFQVGEDYQFQFYLTPDEEYRDVLNAVSVDNEGLVIDWWEPLRIRWGMLPNGETSLNFYRDGENFIARYDFSFAQGGLTLDGIMGELVAECWIEGWEINGINDMVPVQLPSRIEKKPLSLELTGFISELTGTGVQDVYADQTVGFDVIFGGEMQHFDSTQLTVGYDANGIRTMIDCSPNAEGSGLHCSFMPQCTDFTVDTYPSVCGTNLKLFAEYNGDTYNDAAEAESRTFNVKRGEIYFVPEQEVSLNQFDLYTIQNAAPDLQYFADSGIRCGDWTVESFLPREILRIDGVELKSYPVVFGYTTNASGVLDESLLRLDVKFQTGSSAQPQDDVISLRPRSVTSDTILFELDFSSREMLDDGRTAYDALQNAVTITGLEVRYPGSPLMGPASASYQSENLTFALKVATLLDADMDISMPGTVRFGGAAAAEMQMRPFDVYCSQLYQELQCSAELPLDVLNDNGEPILSEVVPDGCWGRIRTTVGRAEIYVNNSVYPQCYLSAVNENGKLMIAGEL